MDERMRINATLSYATKGEIRGYIDGLLAGARAMSAAGRYELDAELTATINAPGSRGPELQPGVIVDQAQVAAARAKIRKMIQADNGGSYDARSRFPGMH